MGAEEKSTGDEKSALARVDSITVGWLEGAARMTTPRWQEQGQTEGPESEGTSSDDAPVMQESAA